MEIVLSELSLAVLLGFVAVVTVLVINFFSYGLRPEKTYDEALEELKGKERGSKGKRDDLNRSPQKKKAKNREVKVKKPGTDGGQVAEDESGSEEKKDRTRKLSSGSGKFKRSESLKNEHVIFADEICAEDEKFSPHPEVQAAFSILHNKDEVPAVDPTGGESMKNSFEETQPLDDLQLIRRKSLQMTPSGSRSSSNRGSR